MSKYNIINDNGEGIYEVRPERSQIRYYVNEPKKTVVAVMENGSDQFNEEIRSFMLNLTKDYDMFCGYRIKPSKTYKGKAHCIGTDEFDLETGMRIAREHLLASYYYDYAMAAVAVYDEITDNLIKFADHIGVIGERLEKFNELSMANYSRAENWKSEN